MKRLLCVVLTLTMLAACCCACTQAKEQNGSAANDQAAASALQLSHSALVLPLDGSLATLYPFHAQDPMALTWESSDETVATVYNGIVEPVAAGTVTITCTDGEQTATCTVTVEKSAKSETTLQLPYRQLTLTVGQTGNVEYTYQGPGAVTVFSNDPSVVLVENGSYTALAAGTAVITVTDGIRHAQCVVNVTGSGAEA